MIILFALGTAMAGNDVRNPGGERIPFVKLRSEVWDVVIRKTADDRARIERVKAQCQGIWVNACAPGVDPELRQLALQSVFQEGVALSGDFTYCSTAVLRDLPQDLGRKLIRGNTDSFCQIFLDPESVRGMRTGNATQGENDLVGRLMGGQNTTSGKVLIKAPPTVEGSGNAQVYEATGERRKPGIAATTPRPEPTPQPTGMPMPMPMPASNPASTAPQTAPVATQPEATGTDFPEHQSKGEFDDFVMPEPSFSRPPEPQADLFEGTSDMPDTPVFVPPEPAPAPEPIDDELAELLAPIPTIDSQAALGNGMTGSPPPAPAPAPEPRFTPPPPEPKSPMASNVPPPQPRMDAATVAVPAPKPEPVAPPKPAPPPKPTGPSEFELEAMEMANMEPLTAKNEDDGKKKKKKGKDEEAAAVGGDEEFDNYIIIDIESLSDE